MVGRQRSVSDGTSQTSASSPITQLPLWTSLEAQDSSSPSKLEDDHSDLVPDSLVSSPEATIQPTEPLVAKKITSESPPPSPNHIQPETCLSSPSTKTSSIKDPRSTNSTTKSTLKHPRPKILRFDGVVIPQHYTKFKKYPRKSKSSRPSHHQTTILKPRRERDHGIVASISLATAITNSFAQNGLETPPRVHSPPPDSHQKPQDQAQQITNINHSIQSKHHQHTSHHLLHPTQMIDRALNTVEAQIVHPTDHTTSHFHPASLKLPPSGQSGRQTVKRPNVLSEDRGRVAGFIERLESWFGPGDIQRGAGRKPTQVCTRLRESHHTRGLTCLPGAEVADISERRGI
jgi:hypothetical protein